MGILKYQTWVILEIDTNWRLIDKICTYFLSSQKVWIHKVQQQSCCIPPKQVGNKCKALVPLFLHPKYTKTLWGSASENNPVSCTLCLWRLGKELIYPSQEGSTFLQAGDNTTTWCLYYLESIFMLLLLKKNNQTFLRIVFL